MKILQFENVHEISRDKKIQIFTEKINKNQRKLHAHVKSDKEERKTAFFSFNFETDF